MAFIPTDAFQSEYRTWTLTNCKERAFWKLVRLFVCQLFVNYLKALGMVIMCLTIKLTMAAETKGPKRNGGLEALYLHALVGCVRETSAKVM